MSPCDPAIPGRLGLASLALVLALVASGGWAGCAPPAGPEHHRAPPGDNTGANPLAVSDDTRMGEPAPQRGDGDLPAKGDAAGDPGMAAPCFPRDDSPAEPTPDYAPFGPTLNSQCLGTNHQAIAGIERVVFLGDSVTVGVPNLYLDLASYGLPAGAGTPTSAFYRNILADELAGRFGLATPNALWRNVDVVHGKALQQSSGDFASCAIWGGANEDLLLPPEAELETCIPESERAKTTLIIMTSGSNNLARMTKHAIDGATLEDLMLEAAEVVQQLDDAIAWVKTPGRFPNGVFLVMGNIYEFTDGTGDVTACPSASLAGYSEAPPDPVSLAQATVWILEQYVRIAVQYGVDLIFMLEHFCGHGWRHDDPTARCYLGPDSPLWFDVSCTHPNELGHQELADQFWSVIVE